MAEFYDHPDTGKLHFRAPAGGLGGGSTSMWDAQARPEDIAAFPQAHARYHALKNKARVDAAKAEVASAIAKEAADVAAALNDQLES